MDSSGSELCLLSEFSVSDVHLQGLFARLDTLVGCRRKYLQLCDLQPMAIHLSAQETVTCFERNRIS
jgi:hypothetical protein